MENSKKEDIIIQLGAQYVRVGLVGDRVPRKTVRSGAALRYGELPPQKYDVAVEELLYNIFYSYLNCSCTGKTVIILEKVFTDTRILETMARVMFRKFKVEKVELALSCVTPLYLTGRYSGIVVSAGGSTCEVMPVAEGYPLFRQFQHLPVGTLSFNKLLRDDLALLNKQVPLSIFQNMTEEELTQIRNNHSIIPASSEPIVVSYKRNRLKLIPDRIAFQLIFGDVSNEEPNLAYAFLEALNSVPQSCLHDICRNVVLAGGLWRIRGMQRYFKKCVLQHLPKFPKLVGLKVREKLGFVSWSFNPSDVSWIGCSIGSAIRNVQHLTIRRTEFNEHGFTQKIMRSYFLSG